MSFRTAWAAIIAAVLIVASAGTVAAQQDRGLIVGGTLASTSEAPWAIALTTEDSPYLSGRWCGAALVTANKIITAAHCITKPASSYTAIQGRANLRDDSLGRTPQISAIWIHPGYNPKTNRHDFAVLTLARPFTGVPTLRLETNVKADRKGVAPTVYGWGDTDDTGAEDAFQKLTAPDLGDAGLPGEQGVRRQRVRRQRERLRGVSRRPRRHLPGRLGWTAGAERPIGRHRFVGQGLRRAGIPRCLCRSRAGCQDAAG